MNRITYIGHATVIIELDGLLLMTDPLLNRRVSHLWRVTPLPRRVIRRPDAILISHLHGDHLHIPSLRRMGKDIPLIVPRGSRHYLEHRGFHNVTEVAAGDTFSIKHVRIDVIPSAHDGQTIPNRPDTESLGYIIRAEQSIYFPGDTDIFPEMKSFCCDLDVALLPVWGYGPTLGPGHMNPQSAAEALTMLRPKMAIPIHWGTYFPVKLGKLVPQFLNIPPHQFVRYAHEAAPEVRTFILDPGDTLDLSWNHPTIQ